MKKLVILFTLTTSACCGSENLCDLEPTCTEPSEPAICERTSIRDSQALQGLSSTGQVDVSEAANPSYGPYQVGTDDNLAGTFLFHPRETSRPTIEGMIIDLTDYGQLGYPAYKHFKSCTLYQRQKPQPAVASKSTSACYDNRLIFEDLFIELENEQNNFIEVYCDLTNEPVGEQGISVALFIGGKFNVLVTDGTGWEYQTEIHSNLSQFATIVN